jgi:dihydroneopterin triphosphate diphosphatase
VPRSRSWFFPFTCIKANHSTPSLSDHRRRAAIGKQSPAGGENNETPLQAAKREAEEEAGIGPEVEFLRLDSSATVPVVKVCGFKWGLNVLVIPEYCFGARLSTQHILLSNEHTEHRWVPYGEAHEMLHWESNKNALWELDYRLRHDVELGNRRF